MINIIKFKDNLIQNNFNIVKIIILNILKIDNYLENY